MVLSECGEIVEAEIKKIPEYHKRAILDEWVIMPNHIHFIIILGDYDYDNGISTIVEKIHEFSLLGHKIHEFSTQGHKIHEFSPRVQKIHEFSLRYPEYRSIENPTPDQIKEYRKQRRKMVVSKIIGKLKQQTSKHINILLHTPKTKNWQANFHDHVIRNDRAYFNIKRYIVNNPQKWDADRFNRGT